MIRQVQQYYEIISSLSKNTVRSYKYAINNFLEYFAVENFEDIVKITTSDIQDWLEFVANSSDSESEETAKNTANARFRVIKAFFNWLVDFGYLEESPCDMARSFKEQKTLKIYLTRKERDRMILSCSNLRNKLLVALAFYTGLRRNELVSIKIKDIKNGKLLVRGKGKKQRSLALNQYVLQLISEYLLSRKDNCEYLFVGKRSGFSNKLNDGDVHPITTESVRYIVKSAAKNAGFSDERIEKIAPHTLRRTFAVNLTKESLASSFQVQKALGHSSVRTTERYLDASGAEIADEVLLKQAPPSLI
jgi:site-specific recombinase XerD